MPRVDTPSFMCYLPAHAEKKEEAYLFIMMMMRVPYILALASGLCALVWEVAWMRAFTPVFGLSVYSTTTVLCAFMAGLGLGSQLAPRVLRRWQRSPWALFALLQVGIGLGGLVVVLLIGPIRLAYAVSAGGDPSTPATGVVRVLLSVLVLLPPTVCMGLTLPTLLHACRVEYAVRPGAARIGWLYGLNTVGGALGCLLVGFLLLYRLGVWGTVCAAAGANMGLALVVALLYLRRPTVAPQEAKTAAPTEGDLADSAPEGPPPVISRVWVLALYGLVGALSFGYELCWFRLLVFYLQAATYSFSLMLALYLFGVGAGSVAFARWLDRRLRTPLQVAQALGIAQVLIGLCGFLALHVYGMISTVWIHLVALMGAESWGVILAQKAVVAGLIIVPPTLLMGVTFPLVARLVKGHGASDAQAVGWLYAVNTFGAIVGTLLTGFVLFDMLGVQSTLQLLSFCSVGVGVAFVFPVLWRRQAGLVFVGGLAGLGLACGLVYSATPARLIVANFARHRGEILYYRESAADITFVYQTGPYRGLAFSDGRGTSTTSPVNNYVNRLLCYSAMIVKPDAKDVLVICMGCGNTASAFAQFPIERLDIVDISSGPFEAAPYFETNLGVLGDSRVHTYVEDGRNFLLKTDRKYDVIEIELPTIHTDGVVFLYTREFYELARSRLKEGGVLSQWIDIHQTRRTSSYRLLETMREQFPEMSVWSNRWSWWAIGVNGPARPLDFPKLRTLFADPRVQADTDRVGSGLEDTLRSLVAYGNPLERALIGATPISDDRTDLDFQIPKLKSPTALGGGVAYYNAPLRKVFEANWGNQGGLQEAGEFPFYATPDHHAQVDRSLRVFARGFPPAMLERICADNGR